MFFPNPEEAKQRALDGLVTLERADHILANMLNDLHSSCPQWPPSVWAGRIAGLQVQLNMGRRVDQLFRFLVDLLEGGETNLFLILLNGHELKKSLEDSFYR